MRGAVICERGDFCQGKSYNLRERGAVGLVDASMVSGMNSNQLAASVQAAPGLCHIKSC